MSCCVVELLCHESMLQRQKEEETNIQRNGAVRSLLGDDVNISGIIIKPIIAHNGAHIGSLLGRQVS